jgi:hypothetical protein
MKALIFGTVIVFFSMCAGRVDDKPPVSVDYAKLKKYIGDSTRYFNPAFYKDQHVGLTYPIDSTRIIDKPSVRTKIGRMPAGQIPGSFSVIYKDAENKELGRYSMWSPFYQRVESPGKGMGIRKVYGGRFEIPLPRDRRIATVTFMEDTVLLLNSDVRRLFSQLRPATSKQ